MKRFILLLIILVFNYTMVFSQQILVGFDHSLGRHLPIEPKHNYTYSQQIYTASQIGDMDGGTITEIRFQLKDTEESLEHSNIWRIYMGYTQKTEFINSQDWVDINSLTEVYNDTIPHCDSNGWIHIDINDWDYNGTDNLIIAIDENSEGYDIVFDDFYCSEVDNNQSIVFYDNDVNPDPSNPPNGHINNYLSNIIFVGLEETCPTPTEINAEVTSPVETILSWEDNGATQWQIEWGEVGFTHGNGTIINNITDTSYLLTGLISYKTYQYYVRADCGNNLFSKWRGPFIWTQNDNCTGIANLDNYTSPITATLKYAHDNLQLDCNGPQKEVFFKITVPDGQQINMFQRSHGFQHHVGTRYGDTCPGEHLIQCFSYPQFLTIHWVNTTGRPQTFYWIESIYGLRDRGGSFTLQWSLSCPTPDSTSATQITQHSVTLDWVPKGYENQWQIFYSPAYYTEVGDTITVDHHPYILNNLMEGVKYRWKVRSLCDSVDETLWTRRKFFTTLCPDVYVPEYIQDFEYAAGCWTEGRGQESEGPSGTTSTWTYGNFGNDPDLSRSAKINISDRFPKEWLISPPFNLSGDNYNLGFNVAVTRYRGTNGITIPEDDYVKLKISTDSGQTWTDLMTWDSNNTPSNTGDEVIINLNNYRQNHVQFAFFATGGTISNGVSYNFYMDNFHVSSQIVTPKLNLLDFYVYPNPADKYINWSSKKIPDFVLLTDILGQKIIEIKKPNINKLHVKDLPNGIYLLKIWSEGKNGIYQIIIKHE